MRVGLIDIGSNTSKLIVVESGYPPSKTGFEVLDQIALPCRLFLQPSENPFILKQSQANELVECLIKFKQLFKKFRLQKHRVVATEAFRKAENSADIVKMIREFTGFQIEIISGQEEAIGVAKGLRTDPIFKHWHDYFALDIGGGSLELIQVKNNQVVELKSLPLGAIQVAFSSTGKRSLTGLVSGKDQQKAVKYVQQIIQQKLANHTPSAPQIITTGGTIVFLRKILANYRQTDQQYVIEISLINQLIEEVCALTVKERIVHFPHLPMERADIFPFGLITIRELMNFFNTDRIYHSYHNLRYGLVSELIEI